MYLVPVKRRMWDLFILFIWSFDWFLGLEPRIEAFIIFYLSLFICCMCGFGGFLFFSLIFFISLHFISFLPANTTLEKAGPN